MERLFLKMAVTRAMPVWIRYLAATLLVAGSLLLRLLLLGPGPEMPFLMFMPAIMASGIVFDRGAGIYASLLSTALGVWFFLPPSRSLVITEATVLLEVAVFLGIALFTAALLEAMHRALASLAAERAGLDQANDQLRETLAQSGTLLSEAVHRARNDLQRLAATLRLQAGASADVTAREALQVASDRIAALARINGRLDRHREEDGRAQVESRGFLEGLIADLDDLAVDMRPIVLTVRAESAMLPMAKAVAIGLIVNELVGNSLKYAFPEEMDGLVEVIFQREGETFLLAVQDNGIGLTAGAAPQGSGLGTRIGRALAGQLGGRLELEQVAPGTERPGLRGSIRFPAAR
ncbi:sensor histidine kinase [Falsiroseomonas tokyonensis]|uniref:histidine kinase n=1 Tax=Falsiroseomonas tokyonensis TaxID=430521 RepID=A0ABV7C1J6_9PROT|nr:DUF4118 domain-containing protein [Falsiroseomonas tokyonensis]MBU8540948.1 DUF4118 domain-containing protein [Falsiroseomonas tokyonensis]